MVRGGQGMGVLPEMIPDNLAQAAELKDLISRRQFAPSDEGRQMTHALIEMLEKNSPPLLESIPAGLMRLFMQEEISNYLGIPDNRWRNIWPGPS